MKWPVIDIHALRKQLDLLQIDVPLVTALLLVIVSSVGVIYTKHMNRNEFIQLQRLEKERNFLNEEWGRLLLEQSTLGNPSRVDKQVRERLDMYVPSGKETVVIRQ